MRKLLSIITKGKNVWVPLFLACLFAISCKHVDEKVLPTSGDASIDQISKKISDDANNALLFYERSKLYYKKGAYDQSILDIQHALKIDSLNPEFYHLLSDAYLEYFNSRGALTTMNKVLAMYPERVPSLLKMAQLKFILKDFDGSVLTVNEAIRLDPQNADAYFMLGMNFKALGDSKRAINAYQTSVELNSGLTDAWIILGEMHEGQDDGKALRYYENAILSNAKSMQALHAKAYFLQNHGNIPGAQQIYKQIIATDSSYADAYLNAGLLYLEADSLEMAYQNFTKMTAIAPRNHMAYYLRGKVAEKKKDVKSAQKDYETALNLKNNDKNVMDALNSLKKRG